MLEQIDWKKGNGLIPAVIQHDLTHKVLMLGYCNEESLKLTIQEQKVYFFSRTKNRIWMKGETSGHILEVINIFLDCDQDTLLIKVIPHGPTCHTGHQTCFHEDNAFSIYTLEHIIAKRIAEKPEKSYTTSLLKKGIAHIAQKVGEEAVETVIACLAEKEKIKDEAADLIYHLVLLLLYSGCSLHTIEQELKQRHLKSS